jgi:hypothetical protein
MDVVALALAALLVIGCVVLVAWPFVREPAPADDSLARLSAPERERLRLEEERDRALAALKELEFDHRTGKVSDEDYRLQVGELRRQAGEALRALDEVRG